MAGKLLAAGKFVIASAKYKKKFKTEIKNRNRKGMIGNNLWSKVEITGSALTDGFTK